MNRVKLEEKLPHVCGKMQIGSFLRFWDPTLVKTLMEMEDWATGVCWRNGKPRLSENHGLHTRGGGRAVCKCDFGHAFGHQCKYMGKATCALEEKRKTGTCGNVRVFMRLDLGTKRREMVNMHALNVERKRVKALHLMTMVTKEYANNGRQPRTATSIDIDRGVTVLPWPLGHQNHNEYRC